MLYLVYLPWFDNQIVSAIQRWDKLYKTFKHSGLETDMDNFEVAKMHLQKMILKKKKSYFEEELGKNRNKLKELWKTLKSLSLSSEKARQSKIFLLYVNDFPQSLSDTGSYLYADDTCIFFQHEDVKKIENVSSKTFSSLCQWFIDNKLSIHFQEDKNKSILFSKTRGLKVINISFGGLYIKQHETVEYLTCQLDSKLSGEAMLQKS